MKNKRKGIQIPILIFLCLAGMLFWYVQDVYPADEQAHQALQSTAQVQVEKVPEGYFFDGAGTEQALIFYPGAKVEYTAYAPLMQQLAEQGVDCFLIRMPCNLALLGKNKADDIIEAYDYEQWYLSGHSLGGAMAASYAQKDEGNLAGLILLAAYPTGTFASDALRMLSIYGSEDGVLNMQKEEAGKEYWPTDSQEICLQGGNHACYGNYGEQKGDHQASILRSEQQKETVAYILSWMHQNRLP